MKLEKKDIAEAFGMRYYSDDGYDESTGNYYHIFKFYKSDKKIRVPVGTSKEDAWEEASNEFLKPLEKILFDNL